jgi:Domain of unknown function (DUF4333)
LLLNLLFTLYLYCNQGNKQQVLEGSVVPQYTIVSEITCRALRQRSVHFAGLAGLLLATTLTACSKTLDVSKIQESIKEDVIKKGGTSLQSVFCPKDIKPEASQTFECVGELEGGNAFVIAVTQEDAEGKVKWDIPNAKGILNLEKLQAIFLASVKPAKGEPPEINCGGIYRAVKPGDSFECIVTMKDPQAAKVASSAQIAKADTTADSGQAAESGVASADQDKASAPTAAGDQNQEKTGPKDPDQAKSADKSQDAAKSELPKEDDKTDQAKSSDPGQGDVKGKPSPAKPGQLVAIRISVDVDGNITWQQILEDAEVKVAATTNSTPSASPSPAATPAPESAPAKTAAKPDTTVPTATDSSTSAGPTSDESLNIED